MVICVHGLETISPSVGVDYSDHQEVLEKMAAAYKTIIEVLTSFLYHCSVLEKIRIEKDF